MRCEQCFEQGPVERVAVDLFRLIDADGDVVSASDMDSDIYVSRNRAEADAAMLAADYGPLAVQSATVAVRWISASVSPREQR